MWPKYGGVEGVSIGESPAVGLNVNCVGSGYWGEVVGEEGEVDVGCKSRRISGFASRARVYGLIEHVLGDLGLFEGLRDRGHGVEAFQCLGGSVVHAIT